MKPFLLALLIALLTSAGCTAPSMVQQLQVQPIAQSNFSDYGVLMYADSAKRSWGVRSLTSETLSVGGALSLAGLSTAALATVGNGAGRGLIAGANFIFAALGIIKPNERDNAFNTGSGLILDAESEYIIGITSAGYCTVPTNRLTTEGAILLQKVNAAIKTTSALIAGLLPDVRDMKTLLETDRTDNAALRSRDMQQTEVCR